MGLPFNTAGYGFWRKDEHRPPPPLYCLPSDHGTLRTGSQHWPEGSPGGNSGYCGRARAVDGDSPGEQSADGRCELEKACSTDSRSGWAWCPRCPPAVQEGCRPFRPQPPPAARLATAPPGAAATPARQASPMPPSGPAKFLVCSPGALWTGRRAPQGLPSWESLSPPLGRGH